MKNEIVYSGYTAQPSDYGCPDGSLTASMNLINEDGAIKPLGQPGKYTGAGADELNNAQYIHVGNGYQHLIFKPQEGGVITWMDNVILGGNEDDPDRITEPQILRNFGDTKIHEINALGNILMVFAEDGIHYFLWRGKIEKYRYLGTKFPEIELSFGLKGEVLRPTFYHLDFSGLPSSERVHGDIFTVEYFETAEGRKEKWEWDISEDGALRTKTTTSVMGNLNKLVADTHKSGKFIYPFFVRYAYRLYDGSLAMASAPILMQAGCRHSPLCRCWKAEQVTEDEETWLEGFYYLFYAVAHTLDYAVVSASELDTLQSLKDIIRSVDIFISAPLYEVNTAEGISKIFYDDFLDEDYFGYSICKMGATVADGPYYQRRTILDMVKTSGIYNERIQDMEQYWEPDENGRMPMPEIVDLPIKGNNTAVSDCSSFYHVASIPLDKLTTERKDVKLIDGVLTVLETRESMASDLDGEHGSHDRLIAEKSQVFNNRLNITGLSKKVFEGFGVNNMLPFADGYLTTSPNNNEAQAQNDTLFCRVYYEIEVETGRTIITEGSSGYSAPGCWPLYIYHPNPNVKRAYVHMKGHATDINRVYTLEMTEHPTLSGSYYFDGWKEPPYQRPQDVSFIGEASAEVSSEDECIIKLPTDVYTSLVNNPFLFSSSSNVSLGTAQVLSICSAVKSLSQGQFGQFPLYAFTTEGVWALETAEDGTYKACQPITRDVCTNVDSITQLDSSVLFATDRGIMRLTGSECTCISEAINYEHPFNVLSSLPMGHQLHALMGHDADCNCLPMLPFSEFIKGCLMAYDYVHQRVVIYNKNVRYAYVLSLKSGHWGMMKSDFVRTINSYPRAFVVSGSGSIVDFAAMEDPNSPPSPGLLITRPLKLGDGDLLKTVNTVIQRGTFAKGHVKSVLYGSRDLLNWHLIHSSVNHTLNCFRGTPYKYFRVALITNLTPAESIFGMTVGFEPRMTNRIR